MAISGSLVKSPSNERTDLVAYWSVPLIDGAHTVEFEHGTTSGKRVIRVDGKVRIFCNCTVSYSKEKKNACTKFKSVKNIQLLMATAWR